MTLATLPYLFEDDGIALDAWLQIDFDDDSFGDIEILSYGLYVDGQRVPCNLTDEYLTVRVLRWVKEQEEAHV